LKQDSDVVIDGLVYVQVLNDQRETEWFIELAKDENLIKGIVGWIDLRDPNINENIRNLKKLANGKLVGIRHLIQSESTTDWILQPSVIRGLQALCDNGLTYDLQLRPRHLKHVPELCSQLPNMRFVIDHIAKPVMDAHVLDTEWFHGLEIASQYKNVFCKL
jgi:L-fuconolactonase